MQKIRQAVSVPAYLIGILCLAVGAGLVLWAARNRGIEDE